jgi:hypothetical protein
LARPGDCVAHFRREAHQHVDGNMGEAADKQTIEVADCFGTCSERVNSRSKHEKYSLFLTTVTRCVHHKPFQARFSH